MVGATGSANLLTNPGFESGESGWESAGSGGVEVVSRGAHGGKKCIAVDGGKDWHLVYQWVDGAVPGGEYEVEFVARCRSGKAGSYIKIEFMNPAGEKTQIDHRFEAGPGWRKLKFNAIAPEDARRVAVTLGANPGPGILYDDVKLTGRKIKLSSDIRFDFRKLGQRVEGFGVHCWSSNMRAAAEFRNLNITHIRLTRDWDSWDQMKAMRKVTDELGIKWLYNKWIFEKEYGGEDKKLEDVPGYARGWIETVKELDRNGCRPHFIDLMNEPDYFGIPEDKYSRLVKLVRKGLDAEGFEDIGIAGPGLTHVGIGWNHKRYLDAMDDETVRSLAVWATHGWEDVWSDMSGSVAIMGERARVFHDENVKRDPDKPRWYTEYATRQIKFHGVRYPHPDYESENYNASYLQAYATRVFENTLALLNNGVHVPFYWCAEDGKDSKKQWGYIGPDGEKKPIYFALKALYGNMPLGARAVVPPEKMDRRTLYAGVYVLERDSESPVVLVGVANSSSKSRTAAIRLTNAPKGLKVTRAEATEVVKWGSLETKTGDTARLVGRKISLRKRGDGYEMKVKLTRNSALAVVLGR